MIHTLTKWYRPFIDAADPSAEMKIDDLYLCPCCFFPTLPGRRENFVCALCWWQDDGQDDATADEVQGGPNGARSLTTARMNFKDHFDIYDADLDHNELRHPSAGRRNLIQYAAKVMSGERMFSFDEFWELYRHA